VVIGKRTEKCIVFLQKNGRKMAWKAMEEERRWCEKDSNDAASSVGFEEEDRVADCGGRCWDSQVAV
jgi:hypothetical protein